MLTEMKTSEGNGLAETIQEQVHAHVPKRTPRGSAEKNVRDKEEIRVGKYAENTGKVVEASRRREFLALAESFI